MFASTDYINNETTNLTYYACPVWAVASQT